MMLRMRVRRVVARQAWWRSCAVQSAFLWLWLPGPSVRLIASDPDSARCLYSRHVSMSCISPQMYIPLPFVLKISLYW